MKKLGQITCEVFQDEEIEKHGRVRLHIEVDNPEDEFLCIMMCAEFLTHLTAQNSNAGYEKALDLIRQGAMTYKTKDRPDLL